jgi:vancomycin resistance protein VanW
VRRLRDAASRTDFASERQPDQPLPVLVYEHQSLIRRKLAGVDMDLQEGKAINLALAAPKVNGVILRPGQTLSFWRLIGRHGAKDGYQLGLTIGPGGPAQDIGGGMCQFTNLLHWLVLHSPLTVTEYHHHNSVDLFPDFDRQVPFGVGTSIAYNYIDYRVTNPTDTTFQFLVHTTDTHLVGELRANAELPHRYNVEEREARFVRCPDGVHRRNAVYRVTTCASGATVAEELVARADAKIMYDESLVTVPILAADAARGHGVKVVGAADTQTG